VLSFLSNTMRGSAVAPCMSVSHQSVLLSASCTFHPLLHCAACRSVSLQPVPVLLSARVIDPSQNPNVREIRKFFKSLKFLYKKNNFFTFLNL
jgi:hypothetical protein